MKYLYTKKMYIIVKSIYSTQNLKSEATGSSTRIYWATVKPDKWLLSKQFCSYISHIIDYFLFINIVNGFKEFL